MDIYSKITTDSLPFNDYNAFTLEGSLQKNSTENLHFHASHQILLFNNGIALLLDEQKKQPLFNSMTAFIPAGWPHRSIVLGRRVEYKSLYIRPELLQGAPTSIRVFDMSELGRALMSRIQLPFREDSQARKDVQQDCLELFLKVLAEDIGKRSVVARLPVANRKENLTITDYLEHNFREKIELKEIARLLPFTPRHISRLFKEEMKISIFEYLKIFRILQASIEIQTTNRTVTEIAYSCGYNSISCFFKDFSQIFSFTPRQFKNRQARVEEEPQTVHLLRDT
jgi:AraC-like DNA-binding protein